MTTALETLPRQQQGAHSQQLLTVLLGDYWLMRSEPIPSAALVSLLNIFGVTDGGARAAIRRLAHRGFFESHRVGRSTSYGVRAHTMSVFVERTFSLLAGKSQSEAWDGQWTIVAYSLTEAERVTRNSLRELLRKHRFGNLIDGLWIRPGNSLDVFEEIQQELGGAVAPGDILCFVDAKLPGGMTAESVVARSFGLEEVALGYLDFTARWSPFASELAAASFGNGVVRTLNDALQIRTSLMREWRELRHADPMLPAELLGASFPLVEAARVCEFLYDALGAPAEEAFRRVVAPYDPDLGKLVTHHTFADLGSLGI